MTSGGELHPYVSPTTVHLKFGKCHPYWSGSGYEEFREVGPEWKYLSGKYFERSLRRPRYLTILTKLLLKLT